MILLILFAVLAIGVLGQNAISIELGLNGTFSLTAGSLQLSSAPVSLLVNGTILSSEGGLEIGSSASSQGYDGLGDFVETRYPVYITPSADPALFISFRVYNESNLIVFDQLFLSTIVTNSSLSDVDSLSSGFPSFSVPSSSSSISFMEFSGIFIDNDASGPVIGNFSGNLPGYVSGGHSGPTLLYNPAGESFLIQPISNFMTASLSVTPNPLGGYALTGGLLGSLSSIPEFYTVGFMLYYDPHSPTLAVETAGRMLLDLYNKSPMDPQRDPFNRYLGITTDHGAYIYYLCGPGSPICENYTAPIMSMFNGEIPYRSVLIDSWWYYKSSVGAVINWTAMDDIFTNTDPTIPNSGFGWMIEQLNSVFVTAHNRYWSSETNYAIQNGGMYNFFIDSNSQMALPMDQRFWIDLLHNSSTQMRKLNTYEQDWLSDSFDSISIIKTDPFAARNWLINMGVGADSSGLTIQYCMPYPRYYLQSVEIPAVTQIRVSDDSVASNGDYSTQWRIGYSSLLALSLALGPSKDGSYTVEFAPGGSVGNSNTYFDVNLAIATLSGGPVGIGDGPTYLGPTYQNATVALRTCDTTGRVLGPSRPASAVDAQFIGQAFPSLALAAASNYTLGELYATYTDISGILHDVVFVGGLSSTQSSLQIGPATLASIRASAFLNGAGNSLGTQAGARAHALHRFRSVHGSSALFDALSSRSSWKHITTLSNDLISSSPLSYLAFSSSLGTIGGFGVYSFSDQSPILVNNTDGIFGPFDFQMFYTTPLFEVEQGQVALLGELGKYVPISNVRFTKLLVSHAGVAYDLMGGAGESVQISYYFNGNVSSFECVLGPAGQAEMMIPQGICLSN